MLRTPSYRRVQALPVLWIVLPAAALVTAGLLWAELGAAALGIVALEAGLLLALLLVLGRFTVELDATRLCWHFGFLGWPRWNLRMDEIAAAEPARTTFMDGWGIRRTREGWLYNASGYGAVRLRLHDGRTLRLGSDEPGRLTAFIQARLPQRR